MPTDEVRQRVLGVINSVPDGAVVSYGQVAELAGLGKGARQVGQILRTLPQNTRIPWHRVVSASGAISLPDPGKLRQIQQLDGEGIQVRNGRVDMQRYRWNPAAGFPEPNFREMNE